MAFWRKKKKRKQGTKPVEKAVPKRRKGLTPLELKLAAMDALSQGLRSSEVAELIGVSDATVHAWRRLFEKDGVEGLRKKPSSVGVKRKCEALEARIVAKREENPEAGVRRIRDELRRQEGLEVSAEHIRQVVNEAVSGNPRSPLKSRPPHVRRFLRSLPQGPWQSGIFSFALKGMYPGRLMGIT